MDDAYPPVNLCNCCSCVISVMLTLTHTYTDHTDPQTHIQRPKLSHRHTPRYINTNTDRQTDRQKDRDTHRRTTSNTCIIPTPRQVFSSKQVHLAGETSTQRHKDYLCCNSCQKFS